MFQTSSLAAHLPLITQNFPVLIGTMSHPNVILAIQDTLLSMEVVLRPNPHVQLVNSGDRKNALLTQSDVLSTVISKNVHNVKITTL